MKLEKCLGHKFNNIELLKEAMTHRSFASERKIPRDNQRLEFLGDAVIQIITTEILFIQYPEKREGELTALRSALVQKKALAGMAKTLNLHEYIYLGKGEARSDKASPLFTSLPLITHYDKTSHTAMITTWTYSLLA